ncbi:Phage tail tube protein [Faunimonas pinastri]|uniref:Phage tail tube protein n=1 Tax=Faunimonas pinastri TaxID=1855383 RepID=A0A1H9Q988_9HYPH|nr:phage tail tube protein [Faunimonas pinastri]SER57071.1 Phage tail tube protein [Faunimonas pinastri]
MAKRIAGIAYLFVDGTQYPLRGNFTVSPDAIERAGIAGQDSVHGYSETPRVPYISGDISLTEDISIETIRAVTNATVTAELANGKTYVLREAWCAAAMELNTRDGQTTVRFEGVSCDEM